MLLADLPIRIVRLANIHAPIATTAADPDIRLHKQRGTLRKDILHVIRQLGGTGSTGEVLARLRGYPDLTTRGLGTILGFMAQDRELNKTFIGGKRHAIGWSLWRTLK